MPHYAFAPPKVQTSGELSTNVANALTSAFDIYNQGRKQEEAKAKQEQSLATIQDPKSSNIQKALAWGNINTKVQEELVKQEQQKQKQALVERILNEGQSQPLPNQVVQPASNEPMQTTGNIPSRVPNVNELRQEFAGNIEQPEQVSPQMTQPTAKMTAAPSQQAQDPFELASLKRRQAQAMALVDPSLSARLDSEATSIEKNAQKEKDRELQREKDTRKERRDIHKETGKIREEIDKEAKHAREHLSSSAVAEKAILSGNVNPKSFSGLARSLFKGSVWAEYFKNPDVALLEAASLSDFSGMKDIFGVRLSDADLLQASGKIISPDKSPEANLAIIRFRRLQDAVKIAREEIADEITEENGGYRPANFSSEIRKRMQERFGDEMEQSAKLAANDGQTMPKFDPKNPYHLSKREEALKMANGDQRKANEILMKEFTK